MKKNKILSVLILLPVLSYSQSGYLSGTSQVGIEPGQSLISLHLGGYGAPRDGRFTLQWIKKGPVPAAAAAAGLNDKLYVVSKGELFSMNPSENNPNWGKAGKALNIRSIAGFNNELYAVDYQGNLVKTKLQGGIKWKRIGSADTTVTSIAFWNNTLFAANGNGSMWSADLA